MPVRTVTIPGILIMMKQSMSECLPYHREEDAFLTLHGTPPVCSKSVEVGYTDCWSIDCKIISVEFVWLLPRWGSKFVFLHRPGHLLVKSLRVRSHSLFLSLLSFQRCTWVHTHAHTSVILHIFVTVYITYCIHANGNARITVKLLRVNCHWQRSFGPSDPQKFSFPTDWLPQGLWLHVLLHHLSDAFVIQGILQTLSVTYSTFC